MIDIDITQLTLLISKSYVLRPRPPGPRPGRAPRNLDPGTPGSWIRDPQIDPRDLQNPGFWTPGDPKIDPRGPENRPPRTRKSMILDPQNPKIDDFGPRNPENGRFKTCNNYGKYAYGGFLPRVTPRKSRFLAILEVFLVIFEHFWDHFEPSCTLQRPPEPESLINPG